MAIPQATPRLDVMSGFAMKPIPITAARKAPVHTEYRQPGSELAPSAGTRSRTIRSHRPTGECRPRLRGTADKSLSAHAQHGRSSRFKSQTVPKDRATLTPTQPPRVAIRVQGQPKQYPPAGSRMGGSLCSRRDRRALWARSAADFGCGWTGCWSLP
jgi:hypothetical protein